MAQNVKNIKSPAILSCMESTRMGRQWPSSTSQSLTFINMHEKRCKHASGPSPDTEESLTRERVKHSRRMLTKQQGFHLTTKSVLSQSPWQPLHYQTLSIKKSFIIPQLNTTSDPHNINSVQRTKQSLYNSWQNVFMKDSPLINDQSLTNTLLPMKVWSFVCSILYMFIFIICNICIISFIYVFI